MSARPQPLAGVTVLDLGHIYNGPYAGFMLAMAGARVIKIEPLKGEHLRHRGAKKSHSVPFALLNSNKECVTLNLKAPRGREIFLEMVKRADVVLENFKAGGLKQYGLDYESLKAINPRLIYCSITGFGQTGPYASRAGYDFMIQGMGGLMSITGIPDGLPGAGP